MPAERRDDAEAVRVAQQCAACGGRSSRSRAVAEERADLGVCVCGTGNGIAMAANKVPGIRAAVVYDVTTAVRARRHGHANVVCFGARTTGATVVADALAAFLAAPEEHGRHDLRIQKLAALDGERAGHRSLEGTP